METVDINLTRLLRMFGGITGGSYEEIELIKRYSYVVNSEHNMYKEFYQYLIGKSYMLEGEYEEVEIRNFYKIPKLNDSLEKLMEILEFLILNKVNPYFENITFNSIVSYTETELIVKFNIER